MTEGLHVAFWNVENLFAAEDAPRPEKLARVIGDDLAGWDDRKVEAKVRQLARVITAMNDGRGPDSRGQVHGYRQRRLRSAVEGLWVISFF